MPAPWLAPAEACPGCYLPLAAPHAQSLQHRLRLAAPPAAGWRWLALRGAAAAKAEAELPLPPVQWATVVAAEAAAAGWECRPFQAEAVAVVAAAAGWVCWTPHAQAEAVGAVAAAVVWLPLLLVVGTGRAAGEAEAEGVVGWVCLYLALAVVAVAAAAVVGWEQRPGCLLPSQAAAAVGAAAPALPPAA